VARNNDENELGKRAAKAIRLENSGGKAKRTAVVKAQAGLVRELRQKSNNQRGKKLWRNQ
jgi:hypothetical protein